MSAHSFVDVADRAEGRQRHHIAYWEGTLSHHFSYVSLMFCCRNRMPILEQLLSKTNVALWR